MTIISIVDDHILLADVLASELRSTGFDVEVADLSSENELDGVSRAADLVLLDLELGAGHASGLDLIGPLIRRGATVIVLTGVNDELVWARCLELGAAGILSKERCFEDLVAEITAAVTTGQVGPGSAVRLHLLELLASHRRNRGDELSPFRELTQREGEILHELMAGRTATEISESSYVSVSTVRSQIKAVLRKLDVGSQLQAVALAYQVGWPHALENAA